MDMRIYFPGGKKVYADFKGLTHKTDQPVYAGGEGSASTPFLLRWVARQTKGASLQANIALLENNAAVAAQIAIALTELV